MADPGENTKRTGPPRPSRFTTGAVGSGHPQGNPQRHTQGMSYTIPASGTGSVHGRSPVQQPTQQFTASSATVNVPTTEAIPTASTAGDSTNTAQATSVTRILSRNRRKSQRALEADGNTQTARTNTRGVTARRSGTLASGGKGAGSGRSGKRMSQSVEKQQRTRLGRDGRVDDGS